MTRQEFAVIAGYLSAAIGKQLERRQAEVYFDALSDLPAEAVQIAAKRAVQETEYPVIPLVGTLRRNALEAMAGILPTWSEEWQTVLTAVSKFGLYRKAEAIMSLSALTADVVRSLGWSTLCDIQSSDLSVIAGQFRMAYESRANRQSTLAALSSDVRPRITSQAAQRIVDGVANRLTLNDAASREE